MDWKVSYISGASLFLIGMGLAFGASISLKVMQHDPPLAGNPRSREGQALPA